MIIVMTDIQTNTANRRTVRMLIDSEPSTSQFCMPVLSDKEWSSNTGKEIQKNSFLSL